MGLTERHWFEDEEPELTERQLEDIVYENKKAYDNGYIKGFHDALKERPQIVRCKYCKWYDEQISMCNDCGLPREQTFFCADGKRREDDA